MTRFLEWLCGMEPVGLGPGEALVSDWYADAVGTFGTKAGRLTLTNRRLVFRSRALRFLGHQLKLELELSPSVSATAIPLRALAGFRAAPDAKEVEVVFGDDSWRFRMADPDSWCEVFARTVAEA